MHVWFYENSRSQMNRDKEGCWCNAYSRQGAIANVCEENVQAELALMLFKTCITFLFVQQAEEMLTMITFSIHWKWLVLC